MIIVVSPAKALDFESPWATQKTSKPSLLKRSEHLVGVLSKKTPDELGSLMSLSDSLAELNFERYQDWSTPFTKKNARPAILSFNGDTYTGLNAPESFSEEDYDYAQNTLRILSGLYGVLRPLDLIQPYRLEMGTRLETEHGNSLYEFWGNSLTESLNKALASSPGEAIIINLASNEYFKSVHIDELHCPVVTPVFLDRKDGGDYKTVSFYAKRARGSMASWVIRNRISKAKHLSDFTEDGYAFCTERSTSESPVFTRTNR